MPNHADSFLTELESTRRKHPALSEHLDLHAALFRAQSRLSPQVTLTPPPAEVLDGVSAEGTPLLSLTGLTLQPAAVAQFAAEVCRLVARYRPDLSDALAPLQALLNAEHDAIQSLAAAYLDGRPLE
ncbi:MAG: hypothetical protein D6796_00480, partial [Caldilineae bacterium]